MGRLEEIEARLAAAPMWPYHWEGPVPSVSWGLGVYVLRDLDGEGCAAESPAYEDPERVGFRDLAAHAPADLWDLVELARAAKEYVLCLRQLLYAVRPEVREAARQRVDDLAGRYTRALDALLELEGDRP